MHAPDMKKIVIKFNIAALLFLSLMFVFDIPHALAAATVTKTITNIDGSKCIFTGKILDDNHQPVAAGTLSNSKAYLLSVTWSNALPNSVTNINCTGFVGIRVGYNTAKGSFMTSAGCKVDAQVSNDQTYKYATAQITQVGEAGTQINKYFVPLDLNNVNSACSQDAPETDKNKASVTAPLKTDTKPGSGGPPDPANKPPTNTPPAPKPLTPGNQGHYNVAPGDYDAAPYSLQNLLPFENLPQFLVRLAQILFMLLGGIATIVILIGAFRMAMSQGNPEALTAAKRNLTWAIVGLLVAILSYSIVAIIQTFLGVQ